MSEKNYYLSIQSTSLAHYIGKALILPSRFYKNRPSDIQTIESDYLILSEEKFLNNSNCAIEIILNKEEIKKLENIQNQRICLYKYPIAISRIKKIFFLDEIQKLKTIDNIERGEGFIPQQLIEIVNEKNISVEIKIGTYKYSEELENKIETYNNILGGLAFVRHAQDGQYSENYFSILSHFNKLIRKDYKKNNFEITNKYNGAFTGEGKFWEQLYPLLYEDITEQDVSTFSKKEDISFTKLNGVLNYETIRDSSITYKIAILSIYGENSPKRKKTNDLISDCKNEKIPKDKQEGIALIYGINNGYSTFRNQYNNKIVKFKMDSLLDYYTVESVFQYVVNDKKDNERFEYIDAIGIEKDITFNKEYETYTILDETIVSDKKTIIARVKEWINERLFKELDIYIDNLFEKIKKLMSEKKELVNNNMRLLQHLNNKQREFKNQSNELKNILDKYNNETKLSEQLKKNEVELKEQLDSKNIEIQNLTTSKNQLSEQLNNKQKEFENQSNELKNIADKYKNKIKLVEELRENEVELKRELENIQDKYNQENQELKHHINELENSNAQLFKQLEEKVEIKDNNLETFDEEKERIIIEQFLELYDKNTTELKKIAKGKGIKSTKKRELIKDILCHKDNNRLL